MTTCILLAGGLGTRLRRALPGVPKCLAPVGGQPFLRAQMQHLAACGVERFVLSLGYLADPVIEAVRQWCPPFEVDWVVERQPLGTGGAALLAMEHASLSEAFIANGDTWLEADIGNLLRPLGSDPGLQMRLVALRPNDEDWRERFGQIAVNGGKAERLLPRGASGPGLVNAGVYRARREAFAPYHPGDSFSMEADVIPALAARGAVGAEIVAGTVVDIGVPDDYRRLCELLAASRTPRSWRAQAA
jgi:D-glycero-alpha-D-manno-heptose 1-phosphate guanylyltransferase